MPRSLINRITELFSQQFHLKIRNRFGSALPTELAEHNFLRFRFFSLTLALLQLFVLLAFRLFSLAESGFGSLQTSEINFISLVIFLTYILLFGLSHLKAIDKLAWYRMLLVRLFAGMSILFSVYLSLFDQESFNFIYLASNAIILVIFYWTLSESLVLIGLGNLFFILFYFTGDQSAEFLPGLFNSITFSFIFLLVSRLVYQLKLQEFHNYQKRIQQASQLAEKNEELEGVRTSFASINKNLLHGLFQFDHQGKLIYCNEFFNSFFNHSTESKGKDFDVLIAGLDFEMVKSIISSEGLVKNLEFSFKNSDDQVQYGLFNCSLEEDHESGHCFYNGSIIDYTEQKENENILANLSLVASKTDNAVFIIDKEEKIEWVNEGFSRITGYSYQEAIGKKPGMLFQGANTDPETVRKIGRKINHGESFMGEMLNYRKDGSEFWVHLNINPVLDQKDKILKYIAVETDITERKNVEQELIQAKEQAENSIKVKEQFLSMVSHELRTPLNAVIGMSHMLLQENPRTDQVESMSTLKFSAEYLLSLINDILDFSKIEAGKIAIEYTNFNFYELIKSIKQTFLYQSKEKNIEFIVNLEKEVPEFLKGDPVRLNQIIINLISNAIKFTDEGYVKLDVQVLNNSGNEFYFNFIVTDTGIGIPSDKLKTIFDRFEQASSSTTRKRGGTGLGLAITKSLVELMGGDISIESDLGKGSVFSFRLRLDKGFEDQYSNENVTPQPNYEDIRGCRILLAEDNKINQLVALKFLKRWELVCDVAEDGKAAVNMVQEHTYDLVLMDLQMPEMDGYEATRIIRKSKRENLRTLPVIALTAASLEVKDSVFQAGMNDFLIKPFNPTELLTKLNKYLAKDKNKELKRLPDQKKPNQNGDKLNLKEMRRITHGDSQFLMELLQLCADQFQKLPVKIDHALADQNWSELKNLLHKTKPSIKMLQNGYLQKSMEQFSQALKNDKAEQIILEAEQFKENVRKILLQVEEKLVSVKKEIKAGLPSS